MPRAYGYIWGIAAVAVAVAAAEAEEEGGAAVVVVWVVVVSMGAVIVRHRPHQEFQAHGVSSQSA